MAQSDDVNLDDLRRRARRRLVGAIVLALSAAVFVPMLLESEPKPLGEDVSVRIPPVDSGKFVSKLGAKEAAEAAKAPAAKAEGTRSEAAKADAAKAEAARAERALTDAGSSAPASNSPSAASASTPASAPPKRSLAEAEQRVLNAPAKAPVAVPAAKAEPAKAEPAKAEAAKTEPAKAEPAKAEAPKSDAPKGEAPQVNADNPGFAVQLAAFSDTMGANALANKLKKAGYPAYTETVTNSKGTLWRVRVGPYPSREAAGASRDKLKGDGYSGLVSPAK